MKNHNKKLFCVTCQKTIAFSKAIHVLQTSSLKGAYQLSKNCTDCRPEVIK